MGVSLVGIGYEEPDKINEALRATGQFTGEQEVPLWRRFVQWREMPTAELESTYEEAKSYIFENEVIEPGPYVHVAHDFISIAEDGFGNEDGTAKAVVDRIEALAKMDKIPAATYGKYFGWDIDMGLFSFGGCAFEPNDNSKLIIAAMKNAQIEAFGQSQAKEAQRLLGLLRKDLEAFGSEFSGKNGRAGYNKTAILHEIDAVEFAKAIFGYVTSGDFAAIGAQLQALADRHRPNGIPEELVWANKVRSTLRNLAEEAGPLEKARMAWFFGFHWKFPTEDVGDA